MMTAFDFEPVMFANVPLRLRLHRARRRLRVHAPPQPPGVRVGRPRAGKADRSRRASISPPSCSACRMKYPIMVAPTAAQVPLHPDGEIGMHRAATAASNTPMILSHDTSTPSTGSRPRRPGRSGGSSTRSRTSRRAGRFSTGGRPPAAPPSWSPSISRRRITSARSRIGISAAAPRPRPAAAARRRAAAPPRARRGIALSTGRLWYTWQYLDEIRKIVKVPLAREGHPHRRRREALPRARRGRRSSCRTTAAGRWTTVRRRSKCCRRSWPR